MPIPREQSYGRLPRNYEPRRGNQPGGWPPRLNPWRAIRSICSVKHVWTRKPESWQGQTATRAQCK